MIQKIIPVSKQLLPAIGLGTWQTFNVLQPALLEPLREILNQMHTTGATVIDTSPMYGHAEGNIGKLLHNTDIRDNFFYATKVWTSGRKEGIQQMEASIRKMGRETLELMQIHNLVDWKTHIETLKEWKAEGRIKYIGITHYTDSMHGELEKIIASQKIDFVQFNYSIISRNAEKRLLPAAAEYGVATLINRPFGEGNLFTKVRNKELPSWAVANDITSWSQFFLKFLVAHAAVTCVIPATSNPAHAADNLKAGSDHLPDEAMRQKMAAYVSSL